jgi:dTDP-4-amino-4,6-dideoxygalactose transaminase
VIIPERVPFSDHVFHQYTLVLKDESRDEMRKYLAEKEIPAMIYYPIPLHMQKAYRDPRYKEGDFPVTEWLCKNVISLPIHTEMKTETLDYICENVLNYLEKVRSA